MGIFPHLIQTTQSGIQFHSSRPGLPHPLLVGGLYLCGRAQSNLHWFCYLKLLTTWAAQSGVSRPKFFPGRERSPFPGRETQRPVFGRKLSFGGKNPVKAGNKKSRKTGCFRAKTPKTDLWHYGLGHLRHQPRSHSPETGFSKSGFPAGTWAAQSGVSRPKFFPGRDRAPSPVRETQRPVFWANSQFWGYIPP